MYGKVVNMRPLCGVIVDVKRSTIVVKLETGVTIHARKNTGHGIGTRVWVSYDFTKNKVAKLYKYNPNLEIEEDKTEEVELAKSEGEDEDIVETTGYDDSGALPPDSDGWEFWNSDSGILELS